MNYSMQVFSNPKLLQQHLLAEKKSGKRIGFVPTMGNLHPGHLSLIDLAKARSDLVVCSIFVNPLQFGAGEDLDSYPRTLKQDSEQLQAKGVDILFTPSEQAMYPNGKPTHCKVIVPRLTDRLCGLSRPGHFAGVTTVVNLLFNIVQPDVAVFGKKDYQQYQVVKAMVDDLMMPIEIIGGEIIRESNGLAMSSRNGYLSVDERQQAGLLRQTLLSASEQIKSGQPFDKVLEQAKQQLTRGGFKVDYVELLNQRDLEPATQSDRQLLIAAAAWLGKPRLLDNLEIEL